MYLFTCTHIHRDMLDGDGYANIFSKVIILFGAHRLPFLCETRLCKATNKVDEVWITIGHCEDCFEGEKKDDCQLTTVNSHRFPNREFLSSV